MNIQRTLLFIAAIIFIFLFNAPNATAGVITKPANNLGLIGYWNFDTGKGGLTAYDMSGQGNHGTLTNMDKNTDWVDGKLRGGLDFDGSGDYVLVPDGTTYDFAAGASFTVTAWVKTAASYDCGTNADNKVAVGYRVGTPTWWFGCNQTTDTMHAFVRDSASNSVNFSGTTEINDGDWHLLILRVDNTADKTAIFVDGVMENETDKNFTGNFSGTATVCIGAYGIECATATSADWNGQIDEVRIYNRALSADEIARLNELTGPKISKPPLSDGLVGYWNFDTGKGGLTAYDMSGQGNHGILTNMDKNTDWIDGKIGGALDFDGSDDAVVITQNSSINDLDTLTISAWVMPDTFGGGNAGRIVDKINGFTSWIPSGRQVFFSSGRWDSGGQWRTGEVIDLDTLYHIAITYDFSSTSNDPIFYINGSLSPTTETTPPSGNLNAEADDLILGNNAAVAGIRTFDGFLDEIRIYNRVLSADEIHRLYQYTGPKIIP